jgi:hypothetical protein
VGLKEAGRVGEWASTASEVYDRLTVRRCASRLPVRPVIPVHPIRHDSARSPTPTGAPATRTPPSAISPSYRDLTLLVPGSMGV